MVLYFFDIIIILINLYISLYNIIVYHFCYQWLVRVFYLIILGHYFCVIIRYVI
jgi:hypothetical protein